MTSKVFIIAGFAGSGKDTLSEMIGKYYGDVEFVAFADRFKQIIANNLPKDILSSYDGLSRLEILDKLKNDDTHTKVFGDLNMREFLKSLLGGAIREIDKDMHCVYVAERIYEIISKNPNAKIVATDNRYINEQDYLLSFNALGDHNEKVDFLLSQISHLNERISENKLSINDSFQRHLVNDRVLSDRDFKFLEGIKWNFIQSLKGLRGKSEPRVLHGRPDWSSVDFSKFGEDDFLRLGLIRVFRPIMDNDFNNGYNKDALIKHVSSYSGMTEGQSASIVRSYAQWGLGTSDMKKYGFCRTNPTSPSEIELLSAGRVGFVIENNYKDGLEYLGEKVSNVLKKMDDLEAANPKRKAPLKGAFTNC